MTAKEIRKMYSAEEPCFQPGPNDSAMVVLISAVGELAALAAEHNELMAQWMKTAEAVPVEVALVRSYLDQTAEALAQADRGMVIMPSVINAVKSLSRAVAIIAGERRNDV